MTIVVIDGHYVAWRMSNAALEHFIWALHKVEDEDE